MNWITLASYTGAVISLMGIGIKIGRILQKLDYVIAEVEKLKQDVKDHDKRITILETKFVDSY
jgi:Trk-type K+ transport system membrane component